MAQFCKREKALPKKPHGSTWPTVWTLKMEKATSQSMGQCTAWESQRNSFPQELPEETWLCQELDFNSGRAILDSDFQSCMAINVCCLKSLQYELMFCGSNRRQSEINAHAHTHAPVPPLLCLPLLFLARTTEARPRLSLGPHSRG